MYVDNNGLRTNSKELVQWFDDSLKAQGEIEMVSEGKFEWFLGVRYTYDHSTGSVEADQESTIDRLLQKYGLTNCNPVKVPMRPDTDLGGLPIPPITEKTTIKRAYGMLVGELMYIAINTRPEISHVVNQCSRYMLSQPVFLVWTRGIESRRVHECGRGASSVLLSRYRSSE